MPTAPRTAPISDPSTAHQASDLASADQKTGLPRHHFTHRGRRMTIFKQSEDPGASWHIHFEVAKRRYKKSLETNIQRRAEERAKDYFDEAVAGKWADRSKKIPKVSTLEDALKVYRDKAPVYKSTVTRHVWAMIRILRTCGLPTDPTKVPLTSIDGSLNSLFQSRLEDEYVSKAKTETEKRSARELALRTSRSLLGQARSIFTRKGHLREEYTKAQVLLPPSIDAFTTSKRRGRPTKREYFAPPDSIITATFKDIEDQRTLDPELYKAFWIAVGAGLRRGEIRRLDWSHFVDRSGKTWISGGIGKDGEHIEVPVQTKAMDKLAEFRKETGPFVKGFDKPARRLNDWMEQHGWKTEKKIHELRAYIGSLIYQVNPNAAMKFMRHKSIRVTEQFYVRYGTAAQPVDVL